MNDVLILALGSAFLRANLLRLPLPSWVAEYLTLAALFALSWTIGYQDWKIAPVSLAAAGLTGALLRWEEMAQVFVAGAVRRR